MKRQVIVRALGRDTVRMWLVAGVMLGFLACAAFGQQQERIVLGLAARDASKYNYQYMKYDRMVPHYKENGIPGSLIEHGAFYREDWPQEKIYETLKQYHVVHLATTCEGVETLTNRHRARARAVAAALAQYVREGGGLFLQARA